MEPSGPPQDGRTCAKVERAVGLTAYRVWRLHLAGAACAFERAHKTVFQALYAKTDRGRSGLPLTRDGWYTEPLLRPALATRGSADGS